MCSYCQEAHTKLLTWHLSDQKGCGNPTTVAIARVDVASVVWYKATVATYNNSTTRRFIPDTSGDPPQYRKSQQ